MLYANSTKFALWAASFLSSSMEMNHLGDLNELVAQAQRAVRGDQDLVNIDGMRPARTNVHEQIACVQKEVEVFVDIGIQQEIRVAGRWIRSPGECQLQVPVVVIGFDTDHLGNLRIERRRNVGNVQRGIGGHELLNLVDVI